jgi:hypothetical protein
VFFSFNTAFDYGGTVNCGFRLVYNAIFHKFPPSVARLAIMHVIQKVASGVKKIVTYAM